jgi:alkaline phosphatase D
MKNEKIILLGIIVLLGTIATIFVAAIGYSIYYVPPVTTPDSPTDFTSPEPTQKTLFLISLDGYRYEYLQNADLSSVRSNIDKIANLGVKAKMIPRFPSITWPNHITLVTGLYPEYHGVVGNDMYDPLWDEYFSIFDEQSVDNSKWYPNDLLWTTAENYGILRYLFSTI